MIDNVVENALIVVLLKKNILIMYCVLIYDSAQSLRVGSALKHNASERYTAVSVKSPPSSPLLSPVLPLYIDTPVCAYGCAHNNVLRISNTATLFSRRLVAGVDLHERAVLFAHARVSTLATRKIRAGKANWA